VDVHPNDYECWKRKNSEFMRILTKGGGTDNNGNQSEVMMRHDGRNAVEGLK